jgi:hypothetical protein
LTGISSTEAEYWSKRSRRIRITDQSELRRHGLFFNKRSGYIRREREVPQFHPNIFKSLREGEFWIDFVKDAEDKDPRGTYGQDLCFAPRLPFSEMPPPEDVPEPEDDKPRPKPVIKDPEDLMKEESGDDDSRVAAEIEEDEDEAA